MTLLVGSVGGVVGCLVVLGMTGHLGGSDTDNSVTEPAQADTSAIQMLSSGDAVETYKGNGPFEYLSTEWYCVRGIKPPQNLTQCADLSIEARSQVALEIIKRAEMADPVQAESEQVGDATADPYADETDPYAW
tara:strand:- start:85 stop:486 length:402 start_codon:yes stop_codon:yes gene_type:complete